MQAAPSWNFDFGSGKTQTGYLPVLADTVFTPETGYGFETTNGCRIQAVDRGGTNLLLSDFCTGASPFLFSVQVPEGNYLVRAVFGDAAGASTNTVKAETRRLMLEKVVTGAGQFATGSFVVNVRTPRISEKASVRLKPREQGVLHWDQKLTLEFNGSRPAICALEITLVPDSPTLFLLGDSTVTDQPNEPWNSWGQMITRFFGTGVAVANHAESGESLSSSLGARRILKVLSTLKAGDYVMVQFGHNDQKDKRTNAPAVFEQRLTDLVDELVARKATPILITSMERMSGVERDTLAGYPDIVRRVGSRKKILVIDLNRMSRHFYQSLGPDLARAFQDGTHHNAYGSYQLARCVVAGIREHVPQLAGHLRDDAGRFDPSSPDAWQAFDVPVSPAFSQDKPDGN